jgi:2-polyprenyl-6-methoxyphenol hydroxylase-like FAD-dependent oxidoreductase
MARRWPQSRVLIVGGGIGGLAAAIALGRRGREVTLLERSAFADESGAGIQLGPNATRALRELGVIEAIEAACFRPEAIWMFDALSGRRLATVPLGPRMEDRYGAPYLTLHRADLHAGLLKVCKRQRSVELRPSFDVTAVEDGSSDVEARGVDGQEVKGSSLIAADGLWSTLRSYVAPNAIPSFAGETAWRALLPRAEVPSPFDAPVVGLWLGPRAHLVHYPVRGGKDLNVVAVVEGGQAARGWNHHGDAAGLLNHFCRWAKLAQSLLEMAQSWRSWSLYRLPRLHRWSAGRIALLGDAAHPVLPFLGQGAALAIEDAVTLAANLEACRGNTSLAFSRYEALRRERVKRVQHQAERLGRLYHLRGPSRLIRNLLLPQRREEAFLKGFDWLYGAGSPEAGGSDFR